MLYALNAKKKTGHLAKNCTEVKSKPFVRTVDCPEAKEETDSETDHNDEFWLPTVVAEPDGITSGNERPNLQSRCRS